MPSWHEIILFLIGLIKNMIIPGISLRINGRFPGVSLTMKTKFMKNKAEKIQEF